MRPCITIRGSVCLSVCPSVHWLLSLLHIVEMRRNHGFSTMGEHPLSSLHRFRRANGSRQAERGRERLIAAIWHRRSWYCRFWSLRTSSGATSLRRAKRQPTDTSNEVTSVHWSIGVSVCLSVHPTITRFLWIGKNTCFQLPRSVQGLQKQLQRAEPLPCKNGRSYKCAVFFFFL